MNKSLMKTSVVALGVSLLAMATSAQAAYLDKGFGLKLNAAFTTTTAIPAVTNAEAGAIKLDTLADLGGSSKINPVVKSWNATIPVPMVNNVPFDVLASKTDAFVGKVTLSGSGTGEHFAGLTVSAADSATDVGTDAIAPNLARKWS